MTNPFDDQDGSFYVLINEEEQHSLWPSFAQVPAGWHIAYGPGTHAGCESYVEEHWTDLRPRSLRDRLNT